MSTSPQLLPLEPLAEVRARRPRGLVVLDGGRGPQVAEHVAPAPIDWTPWILTDEEDMGQSPDHSTITTEMVSSLEHWAEKQGWTHVYISHDNFFGWVEGAPNVRVSPDVFLIERPVSPPYPKSWQLWREGHKAPSFALEIVSSNRTKEYEVNPEKYASLGAQELVIFDPEGVGALVRGKRQPALLRYARDPDGAFALRETSDRAVWSDTLGVWLVATQSHGLTRLRLSVDAQGHDLVPTQGEGRLTERAEKERERAEKEQERAGRLAAEEELIRLRAELARRSTPET